MLSSSVCHLRILHFTGEVVGLTCTFVWSDDIQSPYLVQYHQLPRLSPWWVFVHGPWSLDSGAGRRRFTPWLTTHKPGDACQLPKCPLHFSTWNLGHRWWPCWVSVETEWTDTLIFETCLQWGSEYSGYLCAYPHPCPRRPLKVEATPYTLVSSIPSTTRNAGGAHWDVTSPTGKQQIRFVSPGWISPGWEKAQSSFQAPSTVLSDVISLQWKFVIHSYCWAFTMSLVNTIHETIK